MDFNLTRQQEMLMETVRQFADSELAPRALELDEKGGFPFESLREVATSDLRRS